MRLTAPPFAPLLTALLLLPWPRPASAQVVVPPPIFVSPPAGVYVDPDGMLHHRQVDDKNELATQRLRAKALSQPPKSQNLTYVSLKNLLGEVRSHAQAQRELPPNLRYLSGMTQVRYLFVFPEDADIVIAGTSEPFDATGPTSPSGKVTGRPVIHLDDLVVALRMAGKGSGRGVFGCSIDPRPDALERTNAVMRDLANATRGARMNALKEAVGAQQVRTFGAPPDSRLMFITVAADYKLKRMGLGLDPIPVPGIGLPVDNTRAAANRFWFELDYTPLLVSPENDAFALRGNRLAIKAGALSFDEKGATETAKRFAKNVSAKIPQLATVVPLFADLQNVADLSVVATLIRRDKLDKRVGLDLSWITSEANYRPAAAPTPRTAETLVNYTNGSLVTGGVRFAPAAVVADDNRERDDKGTLKAVRAQPASDNWWKTLSPPAEQAKPK